MLFHGIAKLLHGLEGIKGMLASKGLPAFFAYGAYVGEIIAPLLIIIRLIPLFCLDQFKLPDFQYL